MAPPRLRCAVRLPLLPWASHLAQKCSSSADRAMLASSGESYAPNALGNFEFDVTLSYRRLERPRRVTNDRCDMLSSIVMSCCWSWSCWRRGVRPAGQRSRRPARGGDVGGRGRTAAGAAVRLLAAAGAPVCRAGSRERAGERCRRQTTVFTVKLPVALVARVREQAKASGSTISALVAQALTEFLARGHGKRPRR